MVERTNWVHWHSQFFDVAVLSEDLADVVFFDVPSQGFHYNLQSQSVTAQRGWRLLHGAFLTFALLGAGEPSLGVGLREKLLPLPFGDLVRDLDLDLSPGV